MFVLPLSRTSRPDTDHNNMLYNLFQFMIQPQNSPPSSVEPETKIKYSPAELINDDLDVAAWDIPDCDCRDFPVLVVFPLLLPRFEEDHTEG